MQQPPQSYKDRERFKDIIYVCNSTLDCIVSNRCIPCLYKIVPSGLWESNVEEDEEENGRDIGGGETSDLSLKRKRDSHLGKNAKSVYYKLPPNQRPETCPRSSNSSINPAAAANYYSGLYTSKARLLTVGDGDFSFSLSLARHLGSKCAKKLVCTSHESSDSVLSTYDNCRQHLEELKRLGAHVLHDIDATNLPVVVDDDNDDKGVVVDGKLPYQNYDIIIWNFPCIRAPKGSDGQVQELHMNINLLKAFFQNVNRALRSKNGYKGEVHVTHKTIEPFCWWDIVGIASEYGFQLEGAIIFDRCCYPGYINRKVLDRKSFPSNDALIYIFTSQIKNNNDNNAGKDEDDSKSSDLRCRTLDRSASSSVVTLLASAASDLRSCIASVGDIVVNNSSSTSSSSSIAVKQSRSINSSKSSDFATNHSAKPIAKYDASSSELDARTNTYHSSLSSSSLAAAELTSSHEMEKKKPNKVKRRSTKTTFESDDEN